jgi:hypothetical protein
MKQRSFFSILAAIVLTLLLTGVGGFYWLIASSPLSLLGGASVTEPAAAQFISSQAPVMASLLVNPEKIEALTQLVAPPAQRGQTRGYLKDFTKILLANTGLDYQRDVQPWLGDEVTLAVTTLDIDRNGQNGSQAGYLLALATRDPERSREFLQLFWQAKAKSEVVVEPYKGTTLIYTQAGNSPFGGSSAPGFSQIATALVGDQFVLLANHPKVLRDAINNVQAPELNLISSNGYRQLVKDLKQPRIGLAVVNLPQLAGWLADQPSLSPDRFGKLDIPEEIAVLGLGLTSQGLLAHTVLQLPNQLSAATPTLRKPVEGLRYIPDSVGLLAAGQDLHQLWEEIDQGLAQKNPVADLLAQAVNTWGERWNLDLPENIFSWVTGEYAIGLLPAQETTDWVFIAETSAGATEAIEHLDAVAQAQGFSPTKLTLNNQEVTAWTRLLTIPSKKNKADSPKRLDAQVQGVHTQTGNYEIITSSIEAMDLALKATNGQSVNLDPAFGAGISVLSQPNDGYVYLNWPAVTELAESRLPLIRFVELVGRPLFEHLQSLTLTGVGGEPGLRRAEVFIKLGA